MATVDRRLLQQALQRAQGVSQLAQSGQGFDPRGGVGVLAAQLATAGIGAFAQNKARRALAEQETASQEAFFSANPQLAPLRGSLGPEGRQALAVQLGRGQIQQQFAPAPTPLSPEGKKAADISAGFLPEDAMIAEDIGLTKGQEATDKEFAKEFVDFRARGGFSDVKKQLNQLKKVRKSLEDIVEGRSKKDLTGPSFGLVPDFVKAFSNPEALSTKQRVEEVVQRNLRLILGAQFTEKEGERLISRAYDERLSEAENLKRVDALIKQIDQAARSKESASRHFQKFGTLKGWKGKQPKFNGLPGDLQEEDEAPEMDREAAMEELRRRGLIK